MFQSTYNEVKALVQSKDYKFAGEVVFNNKKRTRLDQALNTITISENEVSGQVSSLDNKTVAINGKITNYNVNFDDDSQKISIEFNVENMKVYIDIKPNGNAFLTIRSGVDDITQAGKVESR